MKYAPDYSDIYVNINEFQSEAVIDIESFGPFIGSAERIKIFEKGYRGASAIETGRPGTGVGLHTANQIIGDHFAGVLTVHQDALAKTFGGTPFFRTTFQIIVPINVR